MMRLYLLLCSAVALRLIAGVATLAGCTVEWLYPASAWASWLGPLGAHEAWLLTRSRPAPPPRC
jgi:hypothetical protein